MSEEEKMPQGVRRITDGVFRADVCYPRPECTAVYLVADGGRGAVIDCGAKAGPPVIAAMVESAGLAPEDVDFIIPTHAHMDHCAAAGRLAQMFPRAAVAAHPSAAPHLLDPHAKLVPAARGLYGDEFFEGYYDDVLPVPADRMRVAEDNQALKVGGRVLQTPHTPGHAWHHLSVWDETSGVVFTGDSLGVSYRDFDSETGGRPVSAPSTPPNQFNPEAMRASITRMRDLKPALAAFAHFDEAVFSSDLAEQTLEIMERWMADAKTLDLSDDDSALKARVTAQMRASLAETTGADPGKVAERFRLDLGLCSAGMVYWLRKNVK